MRRARRAVAFVFVAMIGSACASIIGVDQLSIGECKGGICGAEGGSETGTGPDGSTPDVDLPDGAILPDSAGCPTGNGGPVMAHVGGALNNFCIDTTEVTIGEYRAFLNATVNDAGTIPTECKWKTSFAPGVLGADELPQAGVDWCDAYMFCQWAGKRLCGKVVNSKFTGPVSQTELADPAVNGWFIACSAQGQLQYPYGPNLDPGACNLLETDAGKVLPVRSEIRCVGGYPGIYDMLGNVSEWIDGPQLPQDAGIGDAAPSDGAPAYDLLVVKGGDFTAPEQQVKCAVNGIGARRNTRATALGFRCCADPVP